MAWQDDRAASMGASLAYYTLFSLAPLLLIVIAVAGLWFGPEAARGEIYGQLRSLFGPAGGAAVESLLESARLSTDSVMATLIGVVLMLVGATTVLAELQDILDRIWRAPARAASGVWALLRARVLSFGLILGLGFLLVVSLLLNAAIGALQRWWRPGLGGDATALALADALNATLGFLLLAWMFALIYKLLPRVRIAWRDVVFGAVVTAALLSLGRVAIGLYLGHSAVGSGFGAAGSLVVVLVWVYYSAQIFLFGAEFTWVYAHRHGSRQGLPGGPGMGGDSAVVDR